MKSKAEGLYEFFAGFGLDAYAAQSVPEDATFPYLTYTPVFGEWEGPVSITVNLWSITTSELLPFQRVQQVVDRVRKSPVFAYDGGAILFSVDDGYGQDIPVQTDQKFVKGKYLNLTAEFITA